MSDDPYAWWRSAMAGIEWPLHVDIPVCGYFKMRDRRGANKDLAPIKRPWIPAAIWLDGDGNHAAERGGEPVPVHWIWPWCAKNPIPFEQYQHWHEHGSWPEEAA